MDKNLTKEDIIKILDLEPLNIEGGFFKEIFRSDLFVSKSTLPENFKSEKYNTSTTIYYLLGYGDKSSMHAISGDETWHFYRASSPDVYMSLLVITPEGQCELIKLGNKIEEGQVPQYTVKRNCYMGGKIISSEKNAWALMGNSVSPSFEYVDFRKSDSGFLSNLCPEYSSMIKDLE